MHINICNIIMTTNSKLPMTTLVPDFAHCYVTEDVPYELVVIRGIAEIMQVDTPTSSLGILSLGDVFFGSLNEHFFPAVVVCSIFLGTTILENNSPFYKNTYPTAPLKAQMFHHLNHLM